MKTGRIVALNILLLLVLAGGALAGIYYYNQSVNYLKTDNAHIDGLQVPIAPPAAGRLTEWTGDVGKTVGAGERIGVVQTANGPVDIVSPHAGTIVQQNAVPNTLVAAGIPLAHTYDLSRLYVTANINETSIDEVKIGQTVDIYVDAHPGTSLTGKVSRIGLATASTFSLLPNTNTSGNYTKVTQVIPIEVSIDADRGLVLLPGMSASVRIHK